MGSYGPAKSAAGGVRRWPSGEASPGMPGFGPYDGGCASAVPAEFRGSSSSAASSSNGRKGKGKGRGEFPPEKIFVARLPRAATEATVKAHFEEFGPVARVDLKMGEDGMIRGFGFVTFLHKESAERVLKNYEQNRFEGRWIACEACVPQDGSHREEERQSDPLTAPERIFVGGLPREVSQESVMAHFSAYGEIVDIDLKYDNDGIFRGFGFVTFADKAAAEYLVDHHGHTVYDGKTITCKRAQKFDRVTRADLEAEMEALSKGEAAGKADEDAEQVTNASPHGNFAGMMCPGMGMNMAMMAMMAGAMTNSLAASMALGMGVDPFGMACGMGMPCGMGGAAPGAGASGRAGASQGTPVLRLGMPCPQMQAPARPAGRGAFARWER